MGVSFKVSKIATRFSRTYMMSDSTNLLPIGREISQFQFPILLWLWKLVNLLLHGVAVWDFDYCVEGWSFGGACYWRLLKLWPMLFYATDETILDVKTMPSPSTSPSPSSTSTPASISALTWRRWGWPWPQPCQEMWQCLPLREEGACQLRQVHCCRRQHQVGLGFGDSLIMSMEVVRFY